MNSRAKIIIDFWFVKTPSEKRFKKDEGFDLEIKNNFMEDHNLANLAIMKTGLIYQESVWL